MDLRERVEQATERENLFIYKTRLFNRAVNATKYVESNILYISYNIIRIIGLGKESWRRRKLTNSRIFGLKGVRKGPTWRPKIQCWPTFQLMATRSIVRQKTAPSISHCLPSRQPFQHILRNTFLHAPPLAKNRVSCIGLNSAHISKRRFRNLNMELLDWSWRVNKKYDIRSNLV